MQQEGLTLRCLSEYSLSYSDGWSWVALHDLLSPDRFDDLPDRRSCFSDEKYSDPDYDYIDDGYRMGAGLFFAKN